MNVTLTDTDFSNQQQDQTSVTLDPNESTNVLLSWQTDSGDVGTRINSDGHLPDRGI